MKTVFYNSKIAEFFTPLTGFYTIMLFGFVFTEKNSLSMTVRSHENIHQKQYAECLGAGLCIAFLCTVIFNILWIWIFPFTGYYILYLIEYLVHLIRLRNGTKAYCAISFEREAYDLMGECSKSPALRRSRKSFGWLNYFTSQNDQTP
ncbi:MAG: hypothetical protein LBL07_06980 [Tannerella sp.]|jgi:uncharacterized membrane protein|nr:hypothetical protein [Tannerella sp.]